MLTTSIDLSVYSFDGLPEVANAFVLAKNSGVKIRVAYDAGPIQAGMQTLIDAGIPVIQRPSGLGGINHNKFFVFDARDTVTAMIGSGQAHGILLQQN